VPTFRSMSTALAAELAPCASAPPRLNVVGAVGAPARPRRERVVALDLFRGLMVAVMVIVNFEGSGQHVLPGLAHAPWNGLTFADIVFPGFLVAMGAAMALGTRERRWGRVVRRSAALFGLGFGLNIFPNFDLAHVHTMGVLQRIAVCYLLASVVLRGLSSVRARVTFCVLALIAYWAVLAAGWPLHLGIAATPHDGGVVGAVDRAVLGARHVYAHGPVDPEGVLSTLPALVSVLIGALVAPWLSRAPTRRTARLLITRGIALTALGGAWAVILPVNKRLWTSSYTVVTGGIALVVLGLFVALVARRPFPGPSRFRARRLVATVGGNALLMFLAAEEVADTLTRYHVGRDTVRNWAWSHLFASWAGFMAGSVLYASCLLALLVVLAVNLENRQIYVRL